MIFLRKVSRCLPELEGVELDVDMGMDRDVGVADNLNIRIGLLNSKSVSIRGKVPVSEGLSCSLVL